MINKLKSKSGVSLVWAIIVVLIVTMASFTLFNASMTSIANENQIKDGEKAEILATTLSQVVVDEIEEKSETKNSIQQYLSDNIGSGWHYSDVENPFSAPTDVREFPCDNELLQNIKAKSSISMYWKSSQEAELNNDHSQRILHVTVKVKYRTVTASKEFEFEYDQDADCWHYTKEMA